MTNFKVLGAVALGLCTLASCTNDEPFNGFNSNNDENGHILVKDPKITAWSGHEVFGSTGGARSRAEVEAPAAITDAEIEAAKAYFNSKDNWMPANGGDELEIEDLAGWNSYYVQYVVEGNKIPNEVAQYVGTNNEVVSNIAVWNIDADEVLKLLKTDDYNTSDAKVAIESDGQLVVNHPLKDISFETTGYDINMTYYENVRSAGHSGQYYLSANYRIAKLDNREGIYVALYGYTNQNNGYWDRIIKLTKVDIPVETPEEGEEGEEGEGGNNGGNNGGIIIDKIIHNNEVEVNLSLLDLHDKYAVEDLATKLSVHVRYPKDVRVRIPVPTEILVPADDLAVVVSHPELLENYGKEHHADFLIGGNLVELNVSFEKCVNCAGHPIGSEIVVTTKGINQNVIDYCIRNNGDGINFEIFNYYQWNRTEPNGDIRRSKPTTEEINDLKWNWLDSSTVEFGYDNGIWNAYTNISDCPYYYINAFNNDRDREPSYDTQNGADCYVRVIGNQDYYENLYSNMPHLNGSNWNVIYVRDDIFETDKHDDAHREHVVRNEF